MLIRTVRPDELERLREIEVAAGAMFRDIGMPEIADDPPPSIQELASSSALLVAADGDDRPVGYARIEQVDGHAHLGQLSVLPELGRQGIGTALLDAVADWARSRGDAEITLTTFRHVAFNAPYYSRRGYEEVDDDGRGPELTAVMATEAAHGLDPAGRVAMRLRL